ncbi:MAG: sigma-70 family RNA polymerase sigma factor [Rhodobacteraceae bacterium]|nr:sigma-70 family RNA polymerase sigma factor [Paracoccaceae bacterium]
MVFSVNLKRFYGTNVYLDEIKIFDPSEKFNRIRIVLELLDDIALSHSLSPNRDVNPSVAIVGMGPRILEDKGHSWEELMLMVSTKQDLSAFKQLFNHFAPRIKSFLMKAGADPTMAEECSQEAMATVWNKAKLFDPARASASTWIFTIARNKRIDAIRKIRRPEPDELTWPNGMEDAQEDALELKQQSEILADAIQNLPEKQRQLVEKAFFKELSHSEIALETGLPLGTIKSRIRLALERLRHAMG